MSNLISDERFLREYGSFLVNVCAGLSSDGCRPGTCGICGAPVEKSFLRCRQCQTVWKNTIDIGKPFSIDSVAFLAYAVEGGLNSSDHVKRIVNWLSSA